MEKLKEFGFHTDDKISAADTFQVPPKMLGKRSVKQKGCLCFQFRRRSEYKVLALSAFWIRSKLSEVLSVLEQRISSIKKIVSAPLYAKPQVCAGDNEATEGNRRNGQSPKPFDPNGKLLTHSAASSVVVSTGTTSASHILTVALILPFRPSS